jgi:UDP-glucose 4-epimerase
MPREHSLFPRSKVQCVARCLVIGANGFLGSHLVDELAQRGHEVTAFDRFSSGHPFYMARDVVALTGDLLNHADLARALAGQEFVFHFVSTTTPMSAEDDPTLDVRTNVASSIDLFGLCVDAGVSKVYFASTGGAIYGDQSGAPLTELSLPQPVSPYAIGKLTIERYLQYFERKYRLQSVALRISNPYGPRQGPAKVQGVIPIFLRKVHQGMPLTIFGDGSMVRDYVYVTDAASMVADTVRPDTAHSLYNIGSGVGASVNDIVGAIRDITGLAPKIEHAPVPRTFVDHAVLDVDRFNAEFGARDAVTLREGIERTWQGILKEQP